MNTFRMEGIEQVRAKIVDADCQITQLGAGTLVFRGVITRDRHREAVWVHLSRATRAWGTTPKIRYSLVVPLRAPAPAFYEGVPVPPGSIVAYAPGAPYDGVAPAGYEWASLNVPAEAFRAVVRELTGREVAIPERGFRIVRLTTALRDRNVREGQAFAWPSRLPASPDETHEHMEAWVRVFVDALAADGTPDQEPHALASGAAVFARAEAWMRAHLAEPVYLRDVCAAAGVTERTLQTAFRHRLGLTPLEYLRTLRLHEVRRELIARRGDASMTVADVARRWGMLHPGRLSVEYRAQFGESPSVTLGLRSLRASASGGPSPA